MDFQVIPTAMQNSTSGVEMQVFQQLLLLEEEPI